MSWQKSTDIISIFLFFVIIFRQDSCQTVVSDNKIFVLWPCMSQACDPVLRTQVFWVRVRVFCCTCTYSSTRKIICPVLVLTKVLTCQYSYSQVFLSISSAVSWILTDHTLTITFYYESNIYVGVSISNLKSFKIW